MEFNSAFKGLTIHEDLEEE